MKVAFLPITPDHSVAILADKDDNYIVNESIRYRNVGDMWDVRIIYERFVHLSDSTVTVLNVKGEEEFHFPLKWLDPINGMIDNLIQLNILKP